MKPQILIEPQYYIIPLLHLMIGIANNSWWSMYYFFDKFVGNISDKEEALEYLVRNIENGIETLNEDI